MNLGPLSDVVVTELGGRIGAAVCGSVLAQLGASVVVPEGVPEAPDKARHRAELMAGKRSIAIDPQSPANRELLHRIIGRSDVVIVSSDVDQPMPGYDRWIADTTRVVCNLTAFGESGPLAGAPYSEAQIQALSGILDTTGPAELPPTPILLPLVEFMTGIYAAAACQAALRVMRLGGGGQSVDMALYDCAFSAMSTFLARPLSGAEGGGGRIGNRHAMAAPWNIYRAKDGWLLLCAASDDQWHRVTQVLGRPELARDARYLRVVDRAQNVTEVDDAVQTWAGTRSLAQCLDALSSAGIPSGPVTEVDSYPREANLDHRRMINLLRDPVTGRDVRLPSSPLRMSVTPGISPLRIPAPDADRAMVAYLLVGQRKQAPEQATKSAAALPLTGIRVLEIGHYTTAPLTAKHLASLGADVIKIEPPAGEAVRAWAPAKNGIGYFFTCTNSDKRSLVLDLETKEGIASLRMLVAQSDVLIENLKPGALAKRGCSSAELLRLNPRLVYCGVSGFGADSIYAGRPAFDTVIQAMSGVMDLTRTGDIPVKTGVSCADIIGAEMAVVAVIGALETRDRDGVGQVIDLSMQDVAAWVTMPLWNGCNVAPSPLVVAAKDGFVVIDPDDQETSIVASDGGQDAYQDMTREELATYMSSLGWRAAPVLSVREMLDSLQTRSRNLVIMGRDTDGEEWPLLASPIRLKGTPAQVRRPMSALGGDSADILNELNLASKLPKRDHA